LQTRCRTARATRDRLAYKISVKFLISERTDSISIVFLSARHRPGCRRLEYAGCGPPEQDARAADEATAHADLARARADPFMTIKNVLAGIAVRDIEDAIRWYRVLLGRDPDTTLWKV
jgi:hypothetical protein